MVQTKKFNFSKCGNVFVQQVNSLTIPILKNLNVPYSNLRCTTRKRLPELQIRVFLIERLRGHQENIFIGHLQCENVPGDRSDFQLPAYFYADVLSCCVFCVRKVPSVELIGTSHGQIWGRRCHGVVLTARRSFKWPPSPIFVGWSNV